MRRSLLLVTSVSLLLSTAGCGARWSDDQRSEVMARHQDPTAAATGAVGTAGATGALTPSPDGTSGGAGRTGAAPTGSGSGTAEASGSAGVGGSAAGPSACAASTDAPGITDSEITVGSISSLSGPVPGLGASSAAATRAYVAYRNSTGGVCGRQIVLREADDGADSGRYRSIVGGLAPEVFGIVGGFNVGDIGGTEIVAEQQLPVVNIPSDESVSSLPSVFDMNPPFERLDAEIGKYRYLRDQGARRVAMAYLAVGQSRAEANIQRSLMEAAGLEIVWVQELPISTLSYDSAARGVANSGADYLFFIGDTHGNASMATAMADTGYELGVAEYFTFAYGTAFGELAGAAAEGATTWMRTLPNEDADSNAEMATFVAWMDQVAPEDVKDPFAADAWASAKAFFDGLQALPGPITRDAFIAQMQSVGTFDADGMFGSIRLGAELTDGCFVGMRHVAGAWRRMTPDTGFVCT